MAVDNQRRRSKPPQLPRVASRTRPAFFGFNEPYWIGTRTAPTAPAAYISSGPAGAPDDDPGSLAGSKDLPRHRPAERVGARRRPLQRVFVHRQQVRRPDRRRRLCRSLGLPVRDERLSGGAGAEHVEPRDELRHQLDACGSGVAQPVSRCLVLQSCISDQGADPRVELLRPGALPCRQPDLLVCLEARDLQRHPLGTSRGLDVDNGRRLPIGLTTRPLSIGRATPRSAGISAEHGRPAAATDRVLVTGGAGFTRLCPRPGTTRPRATESESLTRSSTGNFASFRLGTSLVRIRAGRCSRLRCVETALEGISTVIHLAAIVGDPACRETPSWRGRRTRGDLQVLDAASSAGVRRFVFLSTCSNYGKMADPNAYVDRGLRAPSGLPLCRDEGGGRR